MHSLHRRRLLRYTPSACLQTNQKLSGGQYRRQRRSHVYLIDGDTVKFRYQLFTARCRTAFIPIYDASFLWGLLRVASNDRTGDVPVATATLITSDLSVIEPGYRNLTAASLAVAVSSGVHFHSRLLAAVFAVPEADAGSYCVCFKIFAS